MDILITIEERRKGTVVRGERFRRIGDVLVDLNSENLTDEEKIRLADLILKKIRGR